MMRSLVLFACLVALVAGCGKKSRDKAIERQIEKQMGGSADATMSDKGLSIKGRTESGEVEMTAGDQARVPDGFPKDIPLYAGAELRSGMKVEQGFSVSLTTTDQVAAVAEWYQKRMEKEGWTQKTSMNMGVQMMFMYEKDGRTANMVVAENPRGEGTMITLTVSERT